MKKGICFLVSMAVLWVYVALSMRSPSRVTLGEPSESMQACYMRARVGDIAEHGFSIMFNNEEVSSEHCYISEKMHLMMPVSQFVNLFRSTLTFMDESEVYINEKAVTHALVFGEERDPDHTFVDVDMIAEAMAIETAWNDEAYSFEIRTHEEDQLPAYYDLREERMLNIVDDQGTFGTCWAFASTAALEISVAEEGEDYSVDHMTMNSGYNISPNAGGDTLMALAYLLSWKGPVYEWDDPYGDGMTDETLEPVKHVQEAIIFTDGDRDKIKRMIIDHGGVESSLYMSISNAEERSEDYNPYAAAYYYKGDMQPNHDIVIVGWDDDYSRENFNQKPAYDGAFICRNSWGEDFGDDGYFYVSYADANLGNYNVSYTKIEDSDNYDHNYQSDLLGMIGALGFSGPDAWFANVYQADSEQEIRAVGLYTVDADTSFDIYLVKGDAVAGHLSEAVYIGSGYAPERGYYTVMMPAGFELEPAEQFAAVVHIHTEDTTRPVAIEYAAGELSSTADITDGEGYISYDGKNWTSAEEEYQCNVCLKVYTEEYND